MVWLFCFCKSLPLIDVKKGLAKAMASLPEIRITAIAPAPEGVAKAMMLSLVIIDL